MSLLDLYENLGYKSLSAYVEIAGKNIEDYLLIDKGLDLETRVRKRFDKQKVLAIDSLFRAVGDIGLRTEYVKVVGERQVNNNKKYDPLRNDLVAKTRIYSHAVEDQNKINPKFIEVSRIITNKGYSWDRKVELLEREMEGVGNCFAPKNEFEVDIIKEMRNYVNQNKRIGDKKNKVNALIGKFENYKNSEIPYLVEAEEEGLPEGFEDLSQYIPQEEKTLKGYISDFTKEDYVPDQIINLPHGNYFKSTPKLSAAAAILLSFSTIFLNEEKPVYHERLSYSINADGCIEYYTPIFEMDTRYQFTVEEPNSADIIRKEYGFPVEGFFQSPLRNTVLGNDMGMRLDPNQLLEGIQEWKMHWGVDIRGEKEIRIPFPSAICAVENHSDFGNLLLGFNSIGAQWLVAHLASFKIPFPNDSPIEKLFFDSYDPNRQIIPSTIKCEYIDDPNLVVGIMGRTGKATGVHAHYQLADCSGQAVNEIRPQPDNTNMFYTGCEIISPYKLLRAIESIPSDEDTGLIADSKEELYF